MYFVMTLYLPLVIEIFTMMSLIIFIYTYYNIYHNIIHYIIGYATYYLKNNNIYY